MKKISLLIVDWLIRHDVPVPPEDVCPEVAEEVLDLLGAYDYETRQAEKEWHSAYPERRKQIQAMIDEHPDFARKSRLRYLTGQYEHAKQRLRDNREMFIWADRAGESDEAKRELIREAEKISKQIDRYARAIRAIKNNEEGITDDMIERARQYPIGQIIPVDRRGFATCLWHEEKTPSMYCKGNYVHCFGCNRSGDSIDVYRRVHGAGFVESVKMLQA